MIRRSPAVVLCSTAFAAGAQPIYFNDANMTIALGASMPADPFANRPTADSLASIIDAPSASASEFHNQSTHVWVSGSSLEVDFDLGSEHDLATFHFWNYHGEAFDVDDIDLLFFDDAMTLVGRALDLSPALGNTGSDSLPIFAEDFAIDVTGVRFVNAVLAGTNGQVDFQNMGFTSVVPAPGTGAALLVLGWLGAPRRR